MTAIVKTCGNCGKVVSVLAKTGDTCPHCHCIFDFERVATTTHRKGVNWKLMGAILLAFLVLGVGGILPMLVRHAPDPIRPTDNGTLRDQRTGLEWTQADNGSDIDWYGARDWCAQKAGGWRLPSVVELVGISGENKSRFRDSGAFYWSGDVQRDDSSA